MPGVLFYSVKNEIIYNDKYFAKTTFHGKYSHVADIVRLCQDFREVIAKGIK